MKRKVIIIFIIFILAILIVYIIFQNNSTNNNYLLDENNFLSTDEMIIVCEETGGDWGEQGDPCGHTCDYQRRELRGERLGCVAVVVPGCECGKNKCWNGESCEPL